MLLFISKIAQDNYKFEKIKRHIALWLFVFLIITTVFDMRLYYFQSEFDKVNTEINKIEVANMKQDIEMLKQNKNFPVESTKIEMGGYEKHKEYLSSRSKNLFFAKYILSLYICVMTGFTLFIPDSFLVNSVGFPGLIVVFIYLLPL